MKQLSVCVLEVNFLERKYRKQNEWRKNKITFKIEIESSTLPTEEYLKKAAKDFQEAIEPLLNENDEMELIVSWKVLKDTKPTNEWYVSSSLVLFDKSALTTDLKLVKYKMKSNKK